MFSRPDDDTREWVRDIWNRWFDEVFPPTPEDSDYTDEEVVDEQSEEKLEEEKKKKRLGCKFFGCFVSVFLKR